MSRMSKATTVDLDDDLHRALHLKADETHESVSALVNDAVRGLLAEDLADIDWYDRSVRHEQKNPRDELTAVLESIADPAKRAQAMEALDRVLTPERTPYEVFLKQLETDGTI